MNTDAVGVLEPSRNVLSYKWIVPNFSDYNFVGQCLISPAFSTSYANNNVQWRLNLYPKGTQWPYKDYLSIFLQYLGEVKLIAYVTLSILDDKYNTVLESSIKQNQFQKGLEPSGEHKFVSRTFITNSTNCLLKNDVITILCKIIMPDPISVIVPVSITDNDNKDNLKEFDKFENLLSTGKFSDVTFSIGDKSIRLHKVILASCSPFFQAMFEHNMKENQLNTVEIVNVRYEVMREIVRFMYTNKVNGIDNLAVELLVAADMYSISELKDVCEKSLCDRVNIDNAFEYLKLAIAHTLLVLKSKVIQFIIRNLEDFIDQLQFKTLDSSIVNELFCAIAKKKIVF